jgi:hypothetical protein
MRQAAALLLVLAGECHSLLLLLLLGDNMQLV